MLGLSTTFLGFAMLYNASPRRAVVGLPGRGPRRAAAAAAWLVLALSALAWCGSLGVVGGLIAWLAALSAIGTLVILAAPVAPRWVAAAAVMAMVAAILGGVQTWLR